METTIVAFDLQERLHRYCFCNPRTTERWLASMSHYSRRSYSTQQGSHLAGSSGSIPAHCELLSVTNGRICANKLPAVAVQRHRRSALPSSSRDWGLPNDKHPQTKVRSQRHNQANCILCEFIPRSIHEGEHLLELLLGAAPRLSMTAPFELFKFSKIAFLK